LKEITSLLIAPCGMNCALCSGYQRTKNICQGCNIDDPNKPTYCQTCILKNCETIRTNTSGLCYECDKFPCKRLKQLDKRYSTKYGMSMLENLTYIKEHGMDAFLERETLRWTCPSCGSLVCVHKNICLNCNTPYR